MPLITQGLPEPLRTIHILGICGTAMGAVAAAMRAKGFTVTGSGAGVYPPMSTFLESKGIVLREGYRAENIPDAADLIVVGKHGGSRLEESVMGSITRLLAYYAPCDVLVV